MKKLLKLFSAALVFAVALFSNMHAQTYNKPLSIQALNHTTSSSAISRSLGGLTLSSQNDVTTMFSNPAALQTLDGIQFSIGVISESKMNEQIQRWYSLDWMSMFDLFMEGKTADLRDPVIDPIRVPNPTYQDSVQRNGRNPNWSKRKNQFIPTQIFAAVPFEISGIKFTAGIGFTEYANVNYYYQNKNTFNRDLDYITLPLSTNPIPVSAYWRGETRSRDGSIYGYGFALASEVAENISVGLSGTYFSGTLDDEESREGYGRLDFFAKDFRYTENPYSITWKGTSEIRGLDLTFSAIYRTKKIVFGFTLKPPTNIDRDFTTTGDSSKGTNTIALPQVKGSDKISLPLSGSIGLGINLRTNVFLGAEYEYKPYGMAEYKNKDGRITKPWLNCSSFHFGVEYLPIDFISVRIGYQTKAEVFEQQGNALYGDPVAYTVYSTGVGIRLLENIQLNLGYEYVNMHYEDNWNLNTNVNRDVRNTFFGSISYTIK